MAGARAAARAAGARAGSRGRATLRAGEAASAAGRGRRGGRARAAGVRCAATCVDACAVADAAQVSLALATPHAVAPAAASATAAFDLASAAGDVATLDASSGFVKSFLLIFFSEIGDKTFFIAVLLALRQSKGSVFLGTFGALSAMTLVSAALGEALHLADASLELPGPLAGLPLDDLFAGTLLLWFGYSTLKETYELESGNVKMAEEAEDAEEAIADFVGGEFGKMVASTFALVFAAEWGDKSQLATIALAASAPPSSVITGAIAGFFPICLIAVFTGEALKERVDEKVIGYAGGSLFLFFALATFVDAGLSN